MGAAGPSLLESGLSPEDTIGHLTADDEMRSHRQVGIVAADGPSATYTGEECFEYAVRRHRGELRRTGQHSHQSRRPDDGGHVSWLVGEARADRLFAALAAGEEPAERNEAWSRRRCS